MGLFHSTRPGRHAAAPSAGLLLATVAGCTVPADRAEPPHALEAPASPVVGAVLYQSRMDVDERTVKVKVQNGPQQLEVNDMVLTSSLFTGSMAYPRSPLTLDAGRAVDLPVTLGEPICDAAAGEHQVRVDYTLADGTAGSVELRAVDDGDRIAALHTQECFVRSVGEVAALSIDDAPEVLTAADGTLVAWLTVEVVPPAGGTGRMTVLGVGGTTLLTHVDGATAERLPEGTVVDLDVAGDGGPTSFTFTVAPGRCDPHALAEDKQGTRFPVRVELDGSRAEPTAAQPGTVPLTSPDEVKVALYDFVRAACAE